MATERATERVRPRDLWNVVRTAGEKWFEVNAPRLGASLAYYTIMSLAPLLVISIAVAALIFGRDAVEGQVVWQISNLVGEQGGQFIQAILKSAAEPASGILASVIGLAVLLFSASGVFVELRDSLNIVWGAKAPEGGGLKGMVRYRLSAFVLVLAIGFLLMVSLLMSAAIAAAGKLVSGYLPAPEASLQMINLGVSFLAFTLLFALLYKVVPDCRIEWRDVWVGAVFTSLLFSIGKFLIGLYLGKAGIGSAYGAAGSLVVLLVWVYYSAQIFFFGAVFTHIFAQRHGSLASTAAHNRTEPADDRQFRRPRLA
jgi:membrane protein